LSIQFRSTTWTKFSSNISWLLQEY